MAISYDLKNIIIVKKQSLIEPKKPPEVGIKPGSFGFIEVKYKCPGFDPHVEKFIGPYE